MFRGGRDDVISAVAKGFRRALDGQVVTLRGAGGKNDFIRRRIDQRSNLLPGRNHGCAGLPTKGMCIAGCVAEPGGEKRQHGVQNARIERRGGVVVEINGKFDLRWACGGVSVDAHTAILRALFKLENPFALEDVIESYKPLAGMSQE